MKITNLPLLVLFAALILGCETPSPEGTRNANEAGIVGTVTGLEDGFLELRLPSGRVESYMIPENPAILPRDLMALDWRNPAAWPGYGRKCRIRTKESTMEVGGGGHFIPVLEITSFEWL